MGKFIAGMFTGSVLTIVLAYVLVLSHSVADSNSDNPKVEDNAQVEEEEGIKIERFEAPISYEGKSKAAFEVSEVLGNYALAAEAEDLNFDFFFGKTVLLKSENTKFYNGQIIRLNNPKQIGIYSYEEIGTKKVVPVIDVDLKK